MPTTKCPACGHRNFHTKAQCSNCGAPLASQSIGIDTSLIEYESTQVPAPPVPPRARNLSVQRARPSLPEPIRPAPVIPFQSQTEEYNPYLDYNLGQTTVVREEKYAPEQDDSWLEDPLPWWFPRRKSDIAGSVLEVQSQQEEVHASSGSILRLLGDLIWPDPHQYQQRNNKETIPITVIRVRTLKGTQKVARFRGNLIKANLSLGDNISLWGRNQGGVLFVRRAYNHTAQAIIATRGAPSSLPFWILAFLLAIGIVVLFMTRHLTLPFLH